MTGVLADTSAALSLALAASALVAGAIALVATRGLPAALPVLLDLLLAAGLVRLAFAPAWSVIASAAVIVVIRHVIGVGLGTGARPWSRGDGPGGRRGYARPRSVLVDLLRPAWRGSRGFSGR